MESISVEVVPQIAAVLEGLEAFVEAEVFSRHAEYAELLDDPARCYDENGFMRDKIRALVREVREASAAAGYYSMFVPESLGGGGLGATALYCAWEHIFRVCGSRYWLGHHAIAHWTKGPSAILGHTSPAMRERVLGSLLAGSATMCFAMSEPDAGSDVWRMRTRATRVDGGWSITGVKQWISNSPYADYAIVFAVTDAEAVKERRGGISAFILPTDAPGFSIDSVIRLFGQLGSNEGIVRFDDVFVADEQILGGEGDGLRIALEGVSMGRLYNAAKAVGLGRWALGMAVEYAMQRVSFDRPIADFQGVSFPLAESATELHAAHLMGLNCARLLDAGRPATKEVAMAKVYSTEVGVRAADRAMQVHGGMGFTNEVGLATAWQQLRVVCVADGSAEILRRQIARRLFKGDLDL